MRILVIGSGGREHALAWTLKNSNSATQVFCAPGNPGIAKDVKCVNIAANKITELADFAQKNQIDLTVVGPEAPLCEGIVDLFRARNLAIFGPSKNASQLEGSKSFAKCFMEKYGIPTAAYQTFNDPTAAKNYIHQQFQQGSRGLVVKADGLAAGKGVIVAHSETTAIEAIDACFGGSFGNAGTSVVVEECLFGEEASILALTDGKTIRPLDSSQDHKRLLDHDQGPNTGGMGAYSPAPVVTEEIWKIIHTEVLNKFLIGIQKEQLSYHGIIYAGIMLTDQGPKVLEFNCRFGDPETQAVLYRLKSDFAQICYLTATEHLDQAIIEWSEKAAVCIVMASGGYPNQYQKGFSITGIDDAEKKEAKVFHAGTASQDHVIVNSGGRVLGVTADGDNIQEAINNAYNAVHSIHWENCFYRTDIGHKAIH